MASQRQPQTHRPAGRHVAAPVWLTVKKALESGALIRATCCESCGGTNKNPRRVLCGHHEDYAKPLDVIWLCQRCHVLRHLELRRAKAREAQAA